MASLRKLLPVPDGALLTGLENSLPAPGKQGEIRWEAMVLKREQLARGSERTHLDVFAQAELITERDVTPSAASRRTHELLPSLDISEMRRRRGINAQTLTQALRESRFSVTTIAAEVPSHVVLEGPKATKLREHLINRSVFAPVHWPERDATVPGTWRSDTLSIPVDHRYAAQDMEHVADLIREFELEEF